MIGYIYFVQAENGLIKIGKSHAIADRVIGLCLQNGTKLQLLGLIKNHFENGLELAQFELSIHKQLCKSRRHGEWFKHTSEVNEFMKTHCNEDCQEINNFVWKIYNVPHGFHSAQIEARKQKITETTSKKRMNALNIAEMYISTYPGSETLKIANGISRTVCMCRSLLSELEKTERVMRTRQRGARYKHNTDVWFIKGSLNDDREA